MAIFVPLTTSIARCEIIVSKQRFAGGGSRFKVHFEAGDGSPVLNESEVFRRMLSLTTRRKVCVTLLVCLSLISTMSRADTWKGTRYYDIQELRAEWGN